MRYLITGTSGQLGYDVLKNVILKKGVVVAFPNRNEMNLLYESSIRDYISAFKPDVIFHCAAYTKVDNAEEEINNCFDVNYKATKIIKEEAAKYNSKLIFVSTDYVFDGTKNVPYEVNDLTNPLNVYGKSKMLGEQTTLEYDKSFVVRTSWVFGKNGNNFVKTMLRLSETRDNLNVVSDQIGTPTYTVDLAALLMDMSYTNKYGIYHATNSGTCSWAEFAKYIFDVNNRQVSVNEIPTSEYLQKAPRPLYSVLSKQNLIDNGFYELPDWHDATIRYSQELILKK